MVDDGVGAEFLSVPPSGPLTAFSTLVGIQRLVKNVGGSLRWSLWAECEQRVGVLG
jgi:hypothetical protein